MENSWITGKPGCGRSTLLKLVYEDDQYKQLLQQWALGSSLLTPSSFSWRAGSELQQNQLGFLQSISYQMLEHHSELVSQVLRSVEQKDIVNAYQKSLAPAWNMTRAKDVFEKILNLQSIRVCILIDGLDEMSWNHLEMAEYLIGLTQKSRVKLLVSGRSNPELLGTFHGCKTLQLHEWTRSDIEVYVRTRMLEYRFLRQQADESGAEFQALVSSVIHKAEGVFIWVKTAVTTLVEGIYKADSIRDLQIRSEKLPPAIFDLYETILRSSDENYEGELKRFLFLILTATQNQLRGPIISLAAVYDSARPDWIVCQSHMDKDTFQKLQARTRRRLQSVCSQFIAFRCGAEYTHWSVDFMHKSVYDFLETPKMKTWLSTGNPDRAFFYIANQMAEYAGKFSGSRSSHRSGFLWKMLEVRLCPPDLAPVTKPLISALEQLKTVAPAWIAHLDSYPLSMHKLWRAQYDYFMAYAGSSYLMNVLSQQQSCDRNGPFFGLMLHGQMAESIQGLLRSNIFEVTTWDRVDMLMISTFPRVYSVALSYEQSDAPHVEDLKILNMIEDFHSQDATSIDLYWRKIILIVSCQANIPPGSYREPGDRFFPASFFMVIETLLELGVNVNVLVQCSPTGLGQTVLQSPLRVFRRCEELAKTVSTFYKAKHGWTPGSEDEDVEEISSITQLLLQFGAEDLEQTPSVPSDQPEESKLVHLLTEHRKLVDYEVSHLPRSEDMSGDRGWEFIEYGAQDREAEFIMQLAGQESDLSDSMELEADDISKDEEGHMQILLQEHEAHEAASLEHYAEHHERP